jgi:uncharacterized protein
MNSFEIRNAEKKGRGVFSLVHWDTNQVILKFNGKLITKQSMLEMTAEQSALLLQIDSEIYLDLSGDMSLFINHSCNPNTTIKIIAKNAFLISTRAIKPNEELSYDYSVSCTESPEEWKMDCRCGEWNCRKVISGFASLDQKVRELYLKSNIAPNYVKKNLEVK